MKNLVLDVEKFRKFSDEKPNKETMWTGNTFRINIMNLKPGQEIKPHVHDGDHIWIILEGSGEFLSSEGGAQAIDSSRVVVAPSGEAHGVRNNTDENLVFASITV